jgi:hypothetical protein
MNIRSESQAKFAKQGIQLTRQNILMGNMEEREKQQAIDYRLACRGGAQSSAT